MHTLGACPCTPCDGAHCYQQHRTSHNGDATTNTLGPYQCAVSDSILTQTLPARHAPCPSSLLLARQLNSTLLLLLPGKGLAGWPVPPLHRLLSVTLSPLRHTAPHQMTAAASPCQFSTPNQQVHHVAPPGAPTFTIIPLLINMLQFGLMACLTLLLKLLLLWRRR